MSTADRRRLLGPNDASPLYSDITLKAHSSVGDAGKSDDEVRKVFIKTGLVSNANGSSYIEASNIIVEVSVFGPRPIRGSFTDRASFSVECKFLPYLKQPQEDLFGGDTHANNNGRQGLTEVEHKISQYVETAFLPCILLEKYPKSTIDVFITVISTGNTTASSSILNLTNWIVNCSSLAIIDSGIEIKDIVTSGHIKYLKSEERLIVDPLEDEEREDALDCLVSFESLKNDEIVGLWIDGNQALLTEELLLKFIKECSSMSEKVRANFNNYLLKLCEN